MELNESHFFGNWYALIKQCDVKSFHLDHNTEICTCSNGIFASLSLTGIGGIVMQCLSYRKSSIPRAAPAGVYEYINQVKLRKRCYWQIGRVILANLNYFTWINEAQAPAVLFAFNDYLSLKYL